MIDATNRPGVENPWMRWKHRPDRRLFHQDEVEERRRKKRQEGRLTEEQRELAARYLPLARKLAMPIKAIFPNWWHEFESAACLALVESARAFDPSRGLKFSTFARFRIRGALADVGRAMRGDSRDEWGDRPEVCSLTPFAEEHGSVMVAFAPPPVGREADDIDAVEGMLRKLPRKHAEVCRLQYLHGKTHAEIAGRLGISQAEVTRRHKLALEMLWEPTDPDGKPNGKGERPRRRRRQDADRRTTPCSC